MTSSCKSAVFAPDSALDLLRKDSNWLFKIGIGGVINALSLVVFVTNPILVPATVALNAVVCGYLLRVMKATNNSVTGKKTDELLLPEWNDFPDLAMAGLSWVAVFSGQAMIVLIAVTTAFLVGSAGGALNVLSPNFIVWSISTVLVVAVLTAAVSLFSSLAMVSFAIEERPQAGFAIGKIFRLLRKNPKDILGAWLIAQGLQLCAIAIPTATVFLVFLIPSLMFASQVISANLMAQAWAATDLESQS